LVSISTKISFGLHTTQAITSPHCFVKFQIYKPKSWDVAMTLANRRTEEQNELHFDIL
jgi:hypothetical protein